MDVRQARPTDAPLVLSLALDDGAHLVKGRDWPRGNPVAATLARTLMPIALPGRLWLARDEDSAALLEVQPRRYVIGWDVTRLVLRGPASTALPELVQAAAAHLQRRGVPRLFARCPEGAADELQALEFRPLAREYVLLGPERQPAGETPLPLDSRYRMPQDAWPLHQLESNTTPALIRQLEGLTSLDWSQGSRTMTEIVVERGGRIVAWLGWETRSRRDMRQIGLLVDPEYREVAPQLLHHAMQQAPAGCCLYTRVRDYQVDALRAFLDAGFGVVAEETLLVKHARVEWAPAPVRRVNVATIPSIQAFHTRLGVVGPSPGQAIPAQKEDSR